MKRINYAKISFYKKGNIYSLKYKPKKQKVEKYLSLRVKKIENIDILLAEYKIKEKLSKKIEKAMSINEIINIAENLIEGES